MRELKLSWRLPIRSHAHGINRGNRSGKTAGGDAIRRDGHGDNDALVERDALMASGGSANASVAASRRMLVADFIFEVADSGGETTVGSHVGVAE